MEPPDGEVKRSAVDYPVWFDAWPAVGLFVGLQSQWNVSLGGITGMSYPAIESVLNLYEPRRAKRWALFQELQALERGALRAFSELNPPKK